MMFLEQWMEKTGRGPRSKCLRVMGQVQTSRTFFQAHTQSVLLCRRAAGGTQ
jgi:hypothetical protein